MNFLYIDASLYPKADPGTPMDVYLALRNGSLKVINIDVPLVTFPSFHSEAAILSMYAINPLRRLRYIFYPLNIVMLLATLYCGGHYLVDVIAGIGVAFAAIALAHYYLPARIVGKA